MAAKLKKDQHTPAPWTWSGGSYALTGANHLPILEAVEGTIYSEYSSDSAYVDCRPADAHLIAAAPELLEALEELTAGLYAGEGKTMPLIDGKEVAKARDAIAKAKGQSPDTPLREK